MLSTVYTRISGGPSDGCAYDRPDHEVVAYADDGVWLYRYELDDRGRMVWTGEREPLMLADVVQELEEARR